MDENTTPTSNPPSIRQGCLLIAGSAALYFFGCLGAFLSGSDAVAIVFVVAAVIVFFWGIGKLAMAMWRRMSRPLDHGKD